MLFRFVRSFRRRILQITCRLVSSVLGFVEFAFRLKLRIVGQAAGGILLGTLAFSAAPFTCSLSIELLLFVVATSTGERTNMFPTRHRGVA